MRPSVEEMCPLENTSLGPKRKIEKYGADIIKEHLIFYPTVVLTFEAGI